MNPPLELRKERVEKGLLNSGFIVLAVNHDGMLVSGDGSFFR